MGYRVLTSPVLGSCQYVFSPKHLLISRVTDAYVSGTWLVTGHTWVHEPRMDLDAMITKFRQHCKAPCAVVSEGISIDARRQA